MVKSEIKGCASTQTVIRIRFISEHSRFITTRPGRYNSHIGWFITAIFHPERRQMTTLIRCNSFLNNSLRRYGVV